MKHVHHMDISHCSQDMQEKVLGVADGTITNEKEIEEIFHHLTVCNGCRELYQDYFLIVENDDLQVEDDTVSIDLHYNNGKFVPVSYTPLLAEQQVNVLAEEKVPVVEIEYPYNNQIIRIRILYSNGTIDIAIYSPSNGIKIYLLTGSAFNVATIQNNSATFSSITPGMIVLLFDFKKIVKINVTL
ncbi:MAG: hypothetical protein WBK20_09005 [Spirochaetota bacterium]